MVTTYVQLEDVVSEKSLRNKESFCLVKISFADCITTTTTISSLNGALLRVVGLDNDAEQQQNSQNTEDLHMAEIRH